MAIEQTVMVTVLKIEDDAVLLLPSSSSGEGCGLIRVAEGDSLQITLRDPKPQIRELIKAAF